MTIVTVHYGWPGLTDATWDNLVRMMLKAARMDEVFARARAAPE